MASPRFVLATLVFACDWSYQSQAAEQPSTSSHAPADPQSAGSDTAGPQVNLDTLRFVNPLLQVRLQRLDATARVVAAGPEWWRGGWRQRPPSVPSNRETDYAAEWCYGASRERPCVSAGKPRHSIFLQAEPQQDDVSVLARFTMSARRVPEESYLTSILYFCVSPYTESTAGDEQLKLSFERPASKKTGACSGEPFRLEIPSLPWVTSRVFELAGKGNEPAPRAEYVFYVSAITRPDRPDVLRLFTSPKAFRDHGLAELDELIRQIEGRIGSGSALLEIIPKRPAEDEERDRAFGRRSFAEQRLRRPFPDGYGLSEDQRKSVVAEAVERVQRQQHFLRNHYEELYHAAIATFPFDIMVRDDDER